MSAEATAPTTDTTAAPETQAADTAAPDLSAEVEKWKSLSRKHEERARTNAEAKAELDKLREASATEQEKAILAARRETAKEFGSKLAEAQFRVAAAGLLDRDQLDGLLEVVDLKRFVDDNGDPAIDAITAAVSLNGDPLLNSIKGALGIP
jgi:hypothetical protein